MYSLTHKQKEVLRCIKNDDPIVLVLSGAKRAGKTFVLNLAFLSHIAKFQNSGKAFILGGTTYSSIRRNVLNDWEEILNVKELKLKDDNHIDVLGCKVYVLPGADASSYKNVRGFTSYGAMLNEATTLHNSYVKEVFSRCSGAGARIYMDTNPENPIHPVKTDYIDKDGDKLPNGKLNIKSFHFTLFDNEFLSEDYVQSILKTTPTGMFYDRDILGLWVNAQGVVYKDFNINKHFIKEQPTNIIRYFGGIDWGYQHYGSIVIVGMDINNKFYVVEEITSQFKEIDWWVEQSKNCIKKYGNINFYCDSARPEHVSRLQRENIKAFNGNKKVLAGIEVISKLLKDESLFIIECSKQRILQEFSLYAWNDKTGEPLKINDDVLDALRYAIYSDYILNPKYYKRYNL